MEVYFMTNTIQLLKRKYNILFFLSLSIASFIGLILMVFLLLINSPDHLNLKRPAPYLLLPIYFFIRIVFLGIEINKNISRDKTEEAVKLLLSQIIHELKLYGYYCKNPLRI